MNADPLLRVLVGLVLACLLLLVAQGFGFGRAGGGEGPYRVSLVKSGKQPWLMRVHSETGQVERLTLKGDARWVTLGAGSLDLAGREAGQPGEHGAPRAPTPGPAGVASAPPAPPDAAADSEIGALVEALQPANPREIRAWAAEMLGSYTADAPERSLPVLLAALEDPDAQVVAAAARSLGRSGSAATALPALRGLQDHPDARVQAAARQAVAALQ